MTGPGLHYIGKEEINAVTEVLQSHEMSRYRFSQSAASSSKTLLFERAMAKYLGTKHCLGMNSCTSALLASLHSLGIGPGDEVLVPSYTFVASIAAVIYAGAIPVLCEIDETLTLDPEDVRHRISEQAKAIISVHMLGASCNMDALKKISDEYDLILIEDVAQAMGASYHGHQLGSFGHAGVFSLNIFKTITAGDGGVLSTNDKAVFERAFAFHDHGSQPFREGVSDSHIMFGLNLRMHEMTGAVALEQLRKLPGILEDLRRRKNLLLDYIGSLPYATKRPIHDPNGECGTVIVWLFDSPEIATSVAEKLNTKPLIDSGKHYYGNMRELCTPNSWPYGRCPDHLMQRFGSGCMPRTDDILSRAVAISVGVRDSYLGTSFGIYPDVPDIKIESIAEQFRIGLKAVFE